MSNLISIAELNDCIKQWYEYMGVDTHGVWNKQLAEIVKGKDEDDLALDFRTLFARISALPSADAVSREAIMSAKFHPLPYTHITPTDADAESYKRGWNDALDAVADNAPSAEGGDADMTVIPEGTGLMKPCPDNGADLISRTDAIEALCHNCAYYTDAQCKTDSGYWCESGAMIREDIPSAEVAQVVLCKNCRFYDNLCAVCRCPQWDLSRTEYPKVKANDFCSYGEASDED